LIYFDSSALLKFVKREKESDACAPGVPSSTATSSW